MKRVVLSFGTRPEAIKVAPVFLALKKMKGIEPIVLLTGQHREQLEQALSLFDIRGSSNLDVMTDRQTLPELAGLLIPKIAKKLKEYQADYVLVQGDTLTTFAVAWAAFLEKIPVGYIEAGLRSHLLYEPFPEEANRCLTSVLSEIDFAPTSLAKQNLIREGKNPENILITGQTGIDAILYASQKQALPESFPEGPLVTVTMHRRENWPILKDLAKVLARIAKEFPKYNFIYPVHLNPIVREAVTPPLKDIPNFQLTDPLDYGTMAALLTKSELIITDSGGLQEEGAALHIPVAILRNVTERPEGLSAGILKLAGTDPEKVYKNIHSLLINEEERYRMKQAKNPYGDGKASVRIAEAVGWKLGLTEFKPEDWLEN